MNYPCKHGVTRYCGICERDSLMIGNEMFRKEMKGSRPEHQDLMFEVWSPTPFMTDVYTAEREHEIINWCLHNFGRESSPIHDQQGSWHRGSVTIEGKTWFGFKTQALLDRFVRHFPNP